MNVVDFASTQQLSPRAILITPRSPDEINWEMQQVQLGIARRAYELFLARGCKHGHDWEDWFRAEAELLRPVSLAIAETENHISIRANVLGFEDGELRVSIEPRCVTILGKKQTNVNDPEVGKVGYVDLYPDQILQRIDLSTEVSAEDSVVELQAGLINFELPRVPEKHGVATSAA
jgi:HSP20 family molecular chaperone IbpA